MSVPDPITAAIGSGDQPKPVTMLRIPVLISSTGRQVAVELPSDTTDAELLELIGWLGASLGPSLRAQNKPGPAIVALDGRRLT